MTPVPYIMKELATCVYYKIKHRKQKIDAVRDNEPLLLFSAIILNQLP